MIWLFLLLLSFLQVLLIGTVILLENRAPAKTVGWLFILGFLPVLGSIIFVLFGRKTQGHIFDDNYIPNNKLAKTVRQQTDHHHDDLLPQDTDSHLKLVREERRVGKSVDQV